MTPNPSEVDPLKECVPFPESMAKSYCPKHARPKASQTGFRCCCAEMEVAWICGQTEQRSRLHTSSIEGKPISAAVQMGCDGLLGPTVKIFAVELRRLIASCATREAGKKQAMEELHAELQDLIRPGGEISRSEILAMVESRILFPRSSLPPSPEPKGPTCPECVADPYAHRLGCSRINSNAPFPRGCGAPEPKEVPRCACHTGSVCGPACDKGRCHGGCDGPASNEGGEKPPSPSKPRPIGPDYYDPAPPSEGRKEAE